MASAAFSPITLFTDSATEVYGRGTGTVSGTVKVGGSYVKRRVRVYNRRSGMLIAQTWSDASTGVYSFSNMPTLTNVVVVAIDDTNTYNAVIKDNITAA